MEELAAVAGGAAGVQDAQVATAAEAARFTKDARPVGLAKSSAFPTDGLFPLRSSKAQKLKFSIPSRRNNHRTIPLRHISLRNDAGYLISAPLEVHRQ
jgi:hypothetical protein